MDLDIVDLFSADSKKEVKRICSSIEISKLDIYSLVKLAEERDISFPYLHAQKYIEFIPDNVKLSDKNIDAIRENGEGVLGKEAAKAVNKLFQMPKQIKRTTGHLFYRPDFMYWHLFYFDTVDRSQEDNHWQAGSHIHYVSWLWPNYEGQQLWENFCKIGKKSVGKNEHIRFAAST